jgi:glycosyltransferase involved in cell wall biosynthesis
MDTNGITPKVTVIMPVYNGEKYIALAIQSILNQTFPNFELIIINDGSTDTSKKIAESFSDPRIRILDQDKNLGLVATRNRGFKEARGEYIALLDADDTTSPDRLEREATFLDTHPNFGLVGSQVRLIDQNGTPTGVKWEESVPSEKLPIRLLFGNCFSQSSLMLRKEALPREWYKEGFAPAEDYELWVRILESWKAWNLPTVLLNYRIHGKNTSETKRDMQQKAIETILRSQLEKIGIHPTTEELDIHRKNYAFTGSKEEVKQHIARREQWLQKLKSANETSKKFEVRVFNEVVAERFLTTLLHNANLGLFAWHAFWKSPLSPFLNYKEEAGKLLKLFLKSFVKNF